MSEPRHISKIIPGVVFELFATAQMARVRREAREATSPKASPILPDGTHPPNATKNHSHK